VALVKKLTPTLCCRASNAPDFFFFLTAVNHVDLIRTSTPVGGHCYRVHLVVAGLLAVSVLYHTTVSGVRTTTSIYS